MQEKIDWYQEVVDLEPSSKLFFPLAKMVSETDVPRAVETLQRGLERHPEFIEARFFFVELLHKHSEKDDYANRLKTQLSILSPMLTRYAGFWQAWGNSLSQANESPSDDKALAAAFLGAMCEKEGLSLSAIFAAGLQSLAGPQQVEQAPVEPQQAAPADAPAAAATAPADAPAAAATAPADVPTVAPTTQGKIEAPSISVVQPSIKVTPNKAIKPRVTIKAVERPAVVDSSAAKNQGAEECAADGEDSGDNISLRTRSMADVLAEQGDYNAALEIYDELIQGAEGAEEKQELQTRADNVRTMSSAPAESATAADVKMPSPGKERVISVLESLADRLENRVHS